MAGFTTVSMAFFRTISCGIATESPSNRGVEPGEGPATGSERPEADGRTGRWWEWWELGDEWL